MSTPVRWSLLLSAPGDTASRELQLAPGEVSELGKVNERGAFDAADAATQVLVPPHLVSGRPPASLGRWKLSFELALPTRTQAFTFTRATGEAFSVGRHDQNVLRLPTETLARRHAGFFIDSQGQLWAKDLESHSGTWRGSERIDTWTALAKDEVLRAGQVQVRLTACDAA